MIKLTATDLTGRELTYEPSWDKVSRIIQHETDHLNGVLFTDHLDEKPPQLQEMEHRFKIAQDYGVWPRDEEIIKQMDEMEL